MALQRQTHAPNTHFPKRLITSFQLHAKSTQLPPKLSSDLSASSACCRHPGRKEGSEKKGCRHLEEPSLYFCCYLTAKGGIPKGGIAKGGIPKGGITAAGTGRMGAGSWPIPAALPAIPPRVPNFPQLQQADADSAEPGRQAVRI